MCKKRLQNNRIRSRRIENEKKLNRARSIKHHGHLLKKLHQQHKGKHRKVHLVRNNLLVEPFRMLKNTHHIASSPPPQKKNLFPMHPCSTSLKHQKTLPFSDIFRGQRKSALGTDVLLDYLEPPEMSYTNPRKKITYTSGVTYTSAWPMSQNNMYKIDGHQRRIQAS